MRGCCVGGPLSPSPMSEAASQPVIDYSGPRPPTQPEQQFVKETGSTFGSDKILRLISAGAAVAIILMLALLIGVLVKASIPAVRTFGASFLITTQWRPNALEQNKNEANGNIIMQDGEIVTETLPPVFGALPVIYGTTVSSILSLGIAIPLSFGAAIFMVRVAPHWLVPPVSFLIEFL